MNRLAGQRMRSAALGLLLVLMLGPGAGMLQGGAIPASQSAQEAPFLGAVPEPTAAERERFRTQTIALQKLRTQLLNERMSQAPNVALQAELSKIMAELATLKAREERWRRHQAVVPTGGGALPDDFSLLEQGALDLIAAFAELDKQRGNPATRPTGDAWEILAARFARYDPTMAKQIAAGKLSRASGGDWLRRLLLLKGQCYLNASVAYFNARNPSTDALHVDARFSGLGILEQVLALKGSDNERLGDTSLAASSHLELVGCSTPEGLQLDTSSRCRELLCSYGPWGLAALRFFRDTGLHRRLDLRMMAPYAPPRSVVDAAVDVVADTRNAVPKLSEGDLFGAEVPVHVEEELRELIGDRKSGLIVRGGKSEMLRWKWVQKDPMVKVWFVSPAVFEFGLQEGIEWAWRAVKLWFMGPWGLVVDETIGILGEEVGEMLGEDHPVYAFTSLLVDGNDAGLDSQFLLGSEGLINRQSLTPAFDWSALMRNLGTKMGEAFAKFEIECLFHGIDPTKTGLPPQKSYDGGGVPPVVLHGEVVGFDQVASDEYQRVRRIVRYYQLDLAALAGHTGPYDLSARAVPNLPLAQRYLAKDPEAQARSWPILPTTVKFPLGRREYVADFTPRSQVLELRFDPTTYRNWTTGKDGRPVEVDVQIITQGSPGKEVMNAKLTKPGMTLQLFDTQVDPSGTLGEQIKKRPDQLASAGQAGVPAMSLPGAEPQLVVPEQEVADAYATTRLKTVYELVVRRKGVGRFIGERSILVEPPRTEVYFEELVRIPLRWVAQRDPATKAILGRTGTVKPHSSKVGVVTMLLEYNPNLSPPLPLKPNYQNLLAARLYLDVDNAYHTYGSWKKTGETSVYEVADGVRAIRLKVQLGGSELKPGYVRGTVQVGGQTYFLWGNVRSPGASVQMACDIPVPPGQTTIVARAAGVEASLTMRRLPPSQPTRATPEMFRQAVEKARQAFAQNPGDQAAQTRYLLACQSAAVGYEGIEQYQQASALCLEIDKLAPRYKASGDVDLWKAQYESGFRIGDKASMLRGGQRYIELREGEEARRIFRERGRNNAGLSAQYACSLYGEMLRRWVSMGGEASVAEAIYQTYAQFWAMSGYEGLRLYPQELTIDFGPAQGGR